MRHANYAIKEPKHDPSAREMEVLRLVAEGLQSKEVAQRLGVSPKTVEFHKTRLYKKLGVTGMMAAVRLATRTGLLERYSPGNMSANLAPFDKHSRS